MIPGYLISIIKIVLVVLILVGMIMLLLAINHLTHNDDSLTQTETNRLKQEINDNEKVITRRSVFHNFLARDLTRRVSKQR